MRLRMLTNITIVIISQHKRVKSFRGTKTYTMLHVNYFSVKLEKEIKNLKNRAM